MNNLLERAIEKTTRESIESLRDMPLDERRRKIEKKQGRRLVITRNFPFIGRGNVMRDRTISHEEIEKQLDEVLR